MSHDSATARSSPFRLEGKRLFFAKMWLEGERLEWRAWSWTGRFRRTVPLEQIRDVQWWTVEDRSTNLLFKLTDGSTFSMWARGPGLWRAVLEERLDLPPVSNERPPVKPGSESITPAA